MNSNENLQKISKIKLYVKEMLKKNQIYIYGIGILSQFSLMKHLILFFTIFSLLSIPNLIIYSGYDSMKGMSNTLFVLTLGNLVFTSSNWFYITKEIGNMIIFWNTGVFSNTIGSYGIMPSDSINKNYWINGFGSSKNCQERCNYCLFKTQYEENDQIKTFEFLQILETIFKEIRMNEIQIHLLSLLILNVFKKKKIR